MRAGDGWLMMLQILGILCLLAAAAALILHLRTSYATHGGSLGQDPCVAAATVQVPLMTLLGLAILNNATGVFAFIWWQWFLIWLVETVLVAMTASWIGELGRSRSKRRSQ